MWSKSNIYDMAHRKGYFDGFVQGIENNQKEIERSYFENNFVNYRKFRGFPEFIESLNKSQLEGVKDLVQVSLELINK